MKLMTRDTDYAIRALVFMAQHKKEIVSVSRLVGALGIPRPFLRKLLQVLNNKGILKSYKGTGGGFILARPENKINVIDLIRIFQDDLSINECLFKKGICPEIRTCALRKKINSIKTYALSQLKPVTIAALLEEGG